MASNRAVENVADERHTPSIANPMTSSEVVWCVRAEIHLTKIARMIAVSKIRNSAYLCSPAARWPSSAGSAPRSQHGATSRTSNGA